MNSDGILSGRGAFLSFNIESTFSTAAIASSLEALEDH